jgi:hypothetical protein
MSLKRWVTFAGMIALAGCKLSSDLPDHHYIGYFLVEAKPDGEGQYSALPNGIFFDQLAINGTVSIPDSRLTANVDSCRLDTIVASGDNILPTVDAGSPVVLQYDQTTANMLPDTSPNIVVYNVDGPQAIGPSTRMTFTVPGAEGAFPASSITASMPTAFTLSPIDTAPADSMSITWSSPNGPGVAFVVLLKFTSDSASPDFANQQVRCSWVDDGKGVVPESLAALWRDARPGTRSVDSYRWMTTSSNGQESGLVVSAQLDGSPPTLQ